MASDCADWTKPRARSVYFSIFMRHSPPGADALPVKLVDEIGTLEDAVNYAASIAGDPDLSNWSVCGYPRPQTMLERIMSMVGGYGQSDEAVLLSRLKDCTSAKVLARMDSQIKVR